MARGKPFAHPSQIVWDRAGLALIATLVAAVALAQIAANPEFAGMTHDSEFYVRTAAGISSGVAPRDITYWSVWPIGYPAVIAAIHKITGIHIFWTAKLANILLIAVGICLLRAAYSDRALLFSVLFLAGGMPRIPFMTWAETSFLIAGLGFAIALHRHHCLRSLAAGALVLVAAIALFLTRYIGLFCLMPIGMLGLYYLWRGEIRDTSRLAIVCVLILLFAGAYFWLNYELTGQSGAERSRNTDGTWQLLSSIAVGISKEARYFLAGAVVWLLLDRFRLGRRLAMSIDRHMQIQPSTNPAWPFFILVATTYLVSIVSARWVFHFDSINLRFLFFGTFFLGLAAIDYMLARGHRPGPLALVLVTSTLCWLAYFVPYKALNDDHVMRLDTLPPIMAESGMAEDLRLRSD